MADPVNTGFDPEFGGPLAQFRAALAKRGIDTNIISGVRDDKAQAELVANRDATLSGQPLPYPSRGKVYVAAPVGSSTHEIGLGADVQPVHPADAAMMHKLAQQFGLAMPNWGGHDPYHVQLGNWQDAAATQAKPTPWSQVADLPDAYSHNAANTTPASGGGFVIPGTTITIGGDSKPVQGALAETGPEASNAGGGKTASEGPLDPRQIVFNRLTSNGLLQPHQALGVLWGLGGEGGKGLDPRSYNANDPGGSIGYGQWNRDRRTSLENLAQTQNKTWSDPYVQADHLYNELTNKDYATYQPGVLSALQNAKTSDEATQIFTGKYERPLKDNSAARIKGGSQVATLDDSGNLVLGSAPSLASQPAGASTGGPRDTFARPGTEEAANQQAADNQSLFGKFTQGPIDPKTGKPDPNAKTPMGQMVDAVLNNYKGTQAKVEDAGPEKTALTNMPAPAAHNVSAMGGALLPSVSQTYGQTLNSLSRPLTYNAAPPQAPQMGPAGLQGPAGGFQGSYGSQTQGFGPGGGWGQGVSLNSLPPMPTDPLGRIRPLELDDYGYQGAGYAS